MFRNILTYFDIHIKIPVPKNHLFLNTGTIRYISSIT